MEKILQDRVLWEVLVKHGWSVTLNTIDMEAKADEEWKKSPSLIWANDGGRPAKPTTDFLWVGSRL